MLLLRGATDPRGTAQSSHPFQYMLLLRGATGRQWHFLTTTGFNTCSSCEEQHLCRAPQSPAPCFNTCSSCEEQPGGISSGIFPGDGFNTCSSCEEQLKRNGDTPCGLTFQYMLLLRGATRRGMRLCVRRRSFNTCSSCEEQPRRAGILYSEIGFNTCSSCEEQPKPLASAAALEPVSIHAPLARSN